MISRPSTEQIILDCRRELLDVIGPEVTSDAGKVSVQMVENVLRNVATRAAHEIAWMREETAELESYARDVLAAVPSASALAAPLGRALADLDAAPRTSLHLDDVVATYSAAGEALSCALEAAIAEGLDELSARAARLLGSRSAREIEIMGEWGFVGRG